MSQPTDTSSTDQPTAGGAQTPPAPTGRLPRPTRTLVAVLVAIGAVVGAVAWTVTRHDQDYGPLYYPIVGVHTVGFSNVEDGATLTFGAVNVLNSGDSPATLTDVELVGGDPVAARVTDARTAGPTRSIGGVATSRGDFPPSTPFGVDLEPLRGTVVAPEKDEPGGAQAGLGTELLLRVDVTRLTTDVTFTGVRVTYQYEGRTYTYLDSTGLQLCPRECDA